MFKKQAWVQISQRQRISPFPNYFSMECITKEMRQVIGYAYQEIITFYQKNIGHFFIAEPDYQKVGQGILSKIVTQPEIFAKFAKIIKTLGRTFIKFTKQCNRPKYLRKLSSSQLAGLVREYEQLYKKLYAFYFPAFAQENFLQPYLKKYLFKKTNDESKSNHYWNVLTMAFSAMVNRQELKAALAVAVKISQNKKWLGYFKAKDVGKIVQSVERDKKLFQSIKKHERNFFWLTRDYDGPVLTFEDFIKRLKAHLASNPSFKLKRLLTEEQKVKIQQRQITKTLKVDKKTARLFQTMREAIDNKELRKAVVSQTLYYFDAVLLEIARRLNLTLNQVRHFKVSEIKYALSKGKDFSKILSDRIKLSAWFSKKGKTVVYSGRPAEKYFKQFVKIDRSVNELVGMSAAPGLARGPAKIVINPDAFYKVRKGDIIVTVQVTPVFSTVIALSAGIVCDGGSGILSHSATLAREAGIPCIIGAKYATKILKDRDLIEVDANKGVVRKINK